MENSSTDDMNPINGQYLHDNIQCVVINKCNLVKASEDKRVPFQFRNRSISRVNIMQMLFFFSLMAGRFYKSSMKKDLSDKVGSDIMLKQCYA